MTNTTVRARRGDEEQSDPKASAENGHADPSELGLVVLPACRSSCLLPSLSPSLSLSLSLSIPFSPTLSLWLSVRTPLPDTETQSPWGHDMCRGVGGFRSFRQRLALTGGLREQQDPCFAHDSLISHLT